MKLIVLVVLAFIACAMAKPLDLGGQVGGALGFATGVVAVPVMGLGGGAVGLITNGPEGALTEGAKGAHAGTNLAQQVGGQTPGDHSGTAHGGHSSGGHGGHSSGGHSSGGGLLGGLFN